MQLNTYKWCESLHGGGREGGMPPCLSTPSIYSAYTVVRMLCGSVVCLDRLRLPARVAGYVSACSMFCAAESAEFVGLGINPHIV